MLVIHVATSGCMPVRVQKSKRKGAFQIKQAPETVHFHALQRCARINEAV